VLGAAPVLGAELIMLVKRLMWIVQEKLRLLWRGQPHR